MRSLSIKRLTAAAVGTAMVTSALSAGLAVNTQGDVTSFVQNVKANLNNVEVVAGTNGADISDGIQAAKLAAVLATLNYEEAEGLQMVPDTSGVSLSDKTVKVSSTGGGATVQPTTESFPVVYSTAAPYGTYNYYRTDARSATLTPDTLPGVLSRTVIYAEKTDGTTEQKTFEEQIIIDSGSVQYSENTNPDGHGLYLGLVGGKDKLHYKLDFAKSGTGFYANHSVYEEVPEITILGHTYGIDTEKLEDDEFALYSGEKVTLSSGDEYETSNGYTVKINLITEGGSVTLTVTSPEGSTKTKKLNAGNGFDFFTNEVSVFVQSAAAGFTEQNVQTGIATLRIGTGSLDFEQGDPFPLDPAWKVNAITFSGSVPDRYLQSVDITYGMDSDDAFEKGDFDGSVKKGLASGAVIAGPKNADGDSLFDIQLIGFGGTTSVDTTAIKFESFGNDDYQTMHVWYTDPDGLPNAFTPDPEDEIPDWSGISSNGHLLAVAEDQQFFINDKVFYFKKWETSGTGSTAKMYPVFIAGGKEGIEVKGSEIAKDTATTGTFQLDTVTTNGQTISCTYATLASSRLNDNLNITHHGTTCDVLPDDINVGMEAVMDAAILAPVTMDLRFIAGAQFNYTGETGVDNYYFPTAMLWEANSTYPGATSPILIIADKHTERGWKDDEVGILAGIGVAATVTNASMGDLNLTGFTPFVNTPAVEASSSSTSNIVENLYEITSYGSYFSADGVELEVTVPEAARTTVVKVAKTLEETESTEGTSMYTLSEGDTLGAMTVEEINAEITGLDSISCGAATGMVYTKATAMDPTDLVTTDTAARATYQIVVGGPYVNRIAQAIDTTGLTTTGAGAQYLIASDDGMKVLAAGYTASDTVAAVNELINLLQG